MTAVDLAKADPGKSVSLNLNLRLDCNHERLVDWLYGELIEKQKLAAVRPSSEAQLKETLSCILANLLNANRMHAKCHVALSMQTKAYGQSRYNSWMGYDNLRRVIEYLSDGTNPPLITIIPGFLDRRRHIPAGKVSRIIGTDALRDLFHRYAAVWGDLTRFNLTMLWMGRGELKQLMEAVDKGTLPITRRISIPEGAINHASSIDCIRLKDAEGKLVDYSDTDDTDRMRRDLNRWNEFVGLHLVDLLLPDAQIETAMSDEDGSQTVVFRSEQKERPPFIDFSRTRLHRVFNNCSFEQGGRFYGGWWQGVPARLRPWITVNGCPTREVDYTNLHAAMLYALEGAELQDDAYSIEGVDSSYRKLIKTTFFKMINAGEGQRIEAPNVDALPDGWTWAKIQAAIKEKHSSISKYLLSGHGLRLQCSDADIAESIMLTMMDEDVLVLPIHDSFITYGGCAERLEKVMKSVYEAKMRSIIGLKVDLAAVEVESNQLGRDVSDPAPPSDADLLDHYESQPGYDGYWKRRNEFFANQDSGWVERFMGKQG